MSLTPMNLIYKNLLLAVFCISSLWIWASESESESGQDSLTYKLELSTTFSAGRHTPFWLVSNLNGLGSVKKNNGYLRAAILKDLESSRRFSWGAGIDLVGGWNITLPFSIHQLYVEIKYRSLCALAGAKEIRGDLSNPRLSSGNLLYSGNAFPIPQIRLGIFDYADFWGTNGWFAVKGYIAYGMFTDSNWQESWVAKKEKRTEDVLFHSKGLWIRGGKTKVFPLQAEIGIEMATQFAGKSFKDDIKVSMPHSFKDWIKAFFPQYASRPTFNGLQSSIAGNMMGAYTIAASWLPNSNWGIKAYYEHYFEDQSQMTFEYGWKDGLYGIEAHLPENRVISSVVYEFLYTKDQTGAVNHDTDSSIPEQVSGRDNYFNHSVYQGWSHWGLGIGNPLVISPIYNLNHSLFFHTTRIKGHHIGIAGTPLHDLSYRLLLSYTKNWGTYAFPLPEVTNNFNSLIEATWTPKKMKGWDFKLALAYDGGDLLGKSFGGMITISKKGSFSLKHKNRK